MFPQIFGKYVLEREIASGGMAVVYLATLRGAGGFEKRLVVKQIRAELATDQAFVTRFVDEAKTTVDLSHQNIVPVYELGVEQGVYYIAMELAEGVTLAELLRDGGPLSPAEGAHLGAELCRGLDYAHRRAGVVHRDVTPRNVLIDEEGHVRVIDFGIAAPVAEELRGQKVFGSPGHMPQEQIRGLPLTPATDVFAVGTLLVEAWTGEPPFRRASAEASERALSGPVPRLSEHDAALEPLESVVQAALAFEPAERPQSAEELGRALRSFLRGEDGADVARRLGDRVRRARRAAADDAGLEPSSAGPTPVTSAMGPATPATPASRSSERPSAGDGALESGGAPARPTPTTAPMAAPGARPSEPGDGSVVTRTFAARDQLLEWTAGRPPAEVAGSSREARGSRRWLLWGGAASALAAAVGLLARRSRPPAQESRGGGPPRAARPAPAPTPSMAPPLERASAPPSAAPAPPPPAARVSARRVLVAPPASAREAPAASVARLTLTSDLPATVRVGGRSVGATPQRDVTRPAGRYRVTFDSPELGESVGTTVELAPGQSVGVHAEFTRATPTVRLR
jgi:serine/threonine-protein kinase